MMAAPPSWSERRAVLDELRVDLLVQLRLSDHFWSVLVKYGVLPRSQVANIQEAYKANEDQVDCLIDYVSQGSNDQFEGFLQALSETGRGFIATQIRQGLARDASTATTHPMDTGLTLITEEKRDILKENGPDLIQKVIPSPEMLAALVKYGTLSEIEKSDLTTGDKSHPAQVSTILAGLQTLRHYEGFVCSLIESNQEEVVTGILGEDAQMYIEKHNLKWNNNKLLDEAIATIKGDYVRRFPSGIPEPDGDEPRGIDPEKIYTPLHIIDKTDPESSKIITEEEILDMAFVDQFYVLCVGEPGSGKTMLAHRLTWLWAKGCTTPLSGIRAVILLTPFDEGDSLNKTMRNAVPGKSAQKDLIMDLWRDEPESVLVIVEAFDQFQNPEVIREINQMVKDHATSILLTVRKGHRLITGELASSFNRSVEVFGFSQKEGKSFAMKLLTEIKCVYDVQNFMSIIEHRTDIGSNPHNLMLACLLFSDGEIKCEHSEDFIDFNLYSMREHRMVERECLRRGDTETEYHRYVRDIRNVALHVLLENRDKCTKSDLESLNIKLDSPGLVLLEKRESFSAKHGRCDFWVWNNPRFLGFDAAKALAQTNDYLVLQRVANRDDLTSVAELARTIQESVGRSVPSTPVSAEAPSPHTPGGEWKQALPTIKTGAPETGLAVVQEESDHHIPPTDTSSLRCTSPSSCSSSPDDLMSAEGDNQTTAEPSEREPEDCSKKKDESCSLI